VAGIVAHRNTTGNIKLHCFLISQEGFRPKFGIETSSHLTYYNKCGSSPYRYCCIVAKIPNNPTVRTIFGRYDTAVGTSAPFMPFGITVELLLFEQAYIDFTVIYFDFVRFLKGKDIVCHLFKVRSNVLQEKRKSNP
jgi:hypothetical protein